MTEKKVKKQLRKMLAAFTAGTVLHLLAELFREDAEEARQEGEHAAERRHRSIEAALFVVGLGIDAASPR